MQLELGSGELADAINGVGELAASPHPSVDNLADWLLVSQLRCSGTPPDTVLAEVVEEGVTLRISRATGRRGSVSWKKTSAAITSTPPSVVAVSRPSPVVPARQLLDREMLDRLVQRAPARCLAVMEPEQLSLQEHACRKYGAIRSKAVVVRLLLNPRKITSRSPAGLAGKVPP